MISESINIFHDKIPNRNSSFNKFWLFMEFMNVHSTVIRTIATNCPKLKSFAFTWHSDLNGSKCEYEHLSFCQQIDELEVTSARSMDYLGTEILFSIFIM